MSRASDGKMRVDSGNSSVIVNPAAGHTIVLDHLKKEAHVVPMQPPGGLPPMPGGLPGMPSPAAPPPPSQVHVQDLGKALIEGHPVDGKRYIFQPPPPPPPPTPPKPPPPPQLPGMPKPPPAPPPPAPPALPPPPTVSEVWTSTKLKMPVLTKTTGSFGQQTCHCKCAETGEPHPSVFQVPPDYKVIMPPPPPPPKPPGLPQH